MVLAAPDWSGSDPTLTSGSIKRFPSRPLFRLSRILAKGVREQIIDATSKGDHLTVGDGRRTPSYGIEQFVEFRSRHCFSRFGDTLIASAKGEFDEISNFRFYQNRRFLTRRGERN
jgi:hypothetical protein